MKHLFSSESVSIGHPDKLADQISDRIVDACLKEDPQSHVACETVISRGLIVITGEISTKARPNYQDAVFSVMKNAGYDFDENLYKIVVDVHTQAGELKKIQSSKGASDQGIYYGYAADETKELMPMPIMLAHKLQNELKSAREQKILPFLKPDGKCLVTVEYDAKIEPQRIENVVLSTQHSKDISVDELREKLSHFIKKSFLDMVDSQTKLFINPAGQFIEGGPSSDTGLTGRKQIVDTYGGYVRHGGGCFSGKDPSKIDRSGCYMARYIAKNIVAAKLAKKCEVQLVYAIGIELPITVTLNTFGSSELPDEACLKVIQQVFDLTPTGIIQTLNLKRPIYQKTAYGGHFGRDDSDFTWERTDKTQELLKNL